MNSAQKYYEKLEDEAHWARIAKEKEDKKKEEKESRYYRIKCFISTLFNL